MIQGGKGLYDYLQGIQAYLAPPIFVVFFFGIFMKRMNGPGCLATLLIGFMMGLFRLAVDTPVKLMGTSYTEGSFLWIVNNVFFQYYSLLITVICIIVFIVVSYATPPPDYAKIGGLTYSTRTAEDKKASRATWNWKDALMAVLLIVAILSIYSRIVIRKIKTAVKTAAKPLMLIKPPPIATPSKISNGIDSTVAMLHLCIDISFLSNDLDSVILIRAL